MRRRDPKPKESAQQVLAKGDLSPAWFYGTIAAGSIGLAMTAPITALYAKEFGASNGVAALAYRAREGLRIAYLQEHLAAGKRVRRTLEPWGRLHLDRSLPFLCLYRRPREGAVAAPTASLHFTDRLLAALDAKGVMRETLTLHVGAGTFLPVKVNDTDDHVMHEEIGILSPETAERLNAAKADGRRIVAVGTTALRLLESAADEDGVIHPFDATTDLFITPGYRFKAVDLLLTNFHLPKSTLFMLVSAFAGLERMKAAYEHAKAEGYRFYSYGDCCLLERTE